MKKLQSVTEGMWVELKNVQPTKEEMELLNSKEEKDIEAKRELLDVLKSKREVEASSEDVVIAQVKYDEVKPKLSDKDVYSLIAFDITIADNGKKLSGILNCRVNTEHKQIRF
jgi:hypothetical protein